MVTWIQDNYVEVLAVIGAVYSLARMIVALTPTEADDAAVKKVGGVLQKIGSLFGLDLQ